MTIRFINLLSAIALAVVLLPRAARTAATPPAPAAHTLTRPDGVIAYDDTGGDGPLIVCVPGMGDVRAQYRFLAPALAHAGFRVVTMDLRGMGESSTGWPDYSAGAVGSDVVALIKQLGVPRAYVVGNSMAAGSAVWAAAEDPDQVAGIVLIGPFVRDLPMAWWQGAALDVAMHRPWGPWFWSMFYGSLYKAAPPADLGDYRASLKRNLSEAGRFEALEAMIKASHAECEAKIPEVHAPALVVMGSRDPDFPDPESEARWVGEHLHGTVLIVDDAGHYPHVEYPDKVAPAIVKLVQEGSNGVAGRN